MNKKNYDVHFLVTLSDFLGDIEAADKVGAKQFAAQLARSSIYVKERLIDYIKSDDFEIKITDVLEIGKDI